MFDAPPPAPRRSRLGALLAVVLLGVLLFLAVPGLSGAAFGPSGDDDVPLGFVVTSEGAELFDRRGGALLQEVGAGVPLAVLAEGGRGYRVLTACNEEAWVSGGSVTRGTRAAGDGPMASAVVVVDAGHGGPDTGAVGSSGLAEKDVNLDVATRLRDLLLSGGDGTPPVAAVVMTRNPDGAAGGDHKVGNRFRATLANRVGANAVVSIHHNAGAQVSRPSPGSEVFYSHDDAGSRRLAGLVAEELIAALTEFDVAWTGGERAGAMSRVGNDGDDWYSLLAWTEAPAVIVEGLYLSNPDEEALAATDEFRDAYAGAVHRALVRFLTTDDEGGPIHDPVPYDAGGVATMGECALPLPGE